MALDATDAWRSVRGTCQSGGGALQVTSNGGASWRGVVAPANAVARIDPHGPDEAYAVTFDDSCRAHLEATFDGGSDWTDYDGVSEFWYRSVSDSTVVATPGGGTSHPCAGGQSVIDLAVTSEGSAVVLCAGGRVRTSADGASWSTSAAISGAVAISVEGGGSDRLYVAVIGRHHCDGIAIIDAADGEHTLSCVPSGAIAPGSVALSTPGHSGWLAIGAATFTSDGALSRWSKS